ncbi:MAG: hypothetical protein CM1200mP18_04560 [Gammaproteobacteria bacterium]|nr:MAG: hypothetical protein CM1200mP18_04560 [Gammaproteobacteria bacterium]
MKQPVSASLYGCGPLNPDGGNDVALPRLIGFRPTQELKFENRELSAQEAVEWGLATRTAAKGTALYCNQAGSGMAEGPTMAYASAKKMLETTFANDFVGQTDIETQEIAGNMAGHDGKEGKRCFFQQTKNQNFKGIR